MSILHAEIGHFPPLPQCHLISLLPLKCTVQNASFRFKVPRNFFTWEALFLNKMMALTDYGTIQLFDEK